MYQFDNDGIKREKRSYKWTPLEELSDIDIVPFSVAEMEWPTAPEITLGLKNYLDTQILGYTKPSEKYYDAVLNWHKKYYGIEASTENIVVTPGVISAVIKLISLMSEKGDGVILLTPSYQTFFMALEVTGRRRVDVDLVHHQGIYTINFEALEKAMEDTKLMILCNPHNPVGRAWNKEELHKIHELATKHKVSIISDEIHGDLMMFGHKHISYHQIDPQATICTAASKSFNLAGLKASNIFIFDKALKIRFENYAASSGSDGANALGLMATEIAYTQGEAWLKEAIKHIEDNYHYLQEAFQDTKIIIAPLEATYLAWLDLENYHFDMDKFFALLENKYHIYCNQGQIFSDKAKTCLRINIATPQKYIQKFVEALIQVIDEFK